MIRKSLHSFSTCYHRLGTLGLLPQTALQMQRRNFRRIAPRAISPADILLWKKNLHRQNLTNALQSYADCAPFLNSSAPNSKSTSTYWNSKKAKSLWKTPTRSLHTANLKHRLLKELARSRR